MAAPYFKDVVVGNVGKNLERMGYSHEAILELANRLADKWMILARANPSKDPATLTVHTEVSVRADRSSVAPLRLSFVLMPRANGEVAGWLVENQGLASDERAEIDLSPIKWTVSFSVVNAYFDDGTTGPGFIICTGDPGDPDHQLTFDDPRQAIEHLLAHLTSRLGLRVSERDET